LESWNKILLHPVKALLPVTYE